MPEAMTHVYAVVVLCSVLFKILIQLFGGMVVFLPVFFGQCHIGC